ncbi:hypothetical protein GDO81_008033 [Engystomops pustulosus]|uniref:Uncharacterized protein n=1 Tax=Engystomops pustulosus TaxID=76066 RepID=A0AAV7CCH9_ENGPU|nr:hypothetical protein GDO81_008033 [Engystomops pustulosus]
MSLNGALGCLVPALCDTQLSNPEQPVASDPPGSSISLYCRMADMVLPDVALRHVPNAVISWWYVFVFSTDGGCCRVLMLATRAGR